MFSAKYESGCRACGKTIYPGDEVTWDGPDQEYVVHATCEQVDFEPVPVSMPERSDRRVDISAGGPTSGRRQATICPGCHVTQPCWCEWEVRNVSRSAIQRAHR